MVGSRWLPAQVLLPLTARTAGVTGALRLSGRAGPPVLSHADGS